MNLKANPKIKNFIQDILFVDEDKGEIEYGGLVFAGDKRLFCGIFIRKTSYVIVLKGRDYKK